MKNIWILQKNNKGFVGLIGLLIALIIIGWLTIKVLNTYYKQSSGVSIRQQQMANLAPEETVNPSSPPTTVIDSVRSRLKNVQNTAAARMKEL